MTSRLTVVLVTYNSMGSHLEALLTSVCDEDVDVVIVDNGSKDGTASLVKGYEDEQDGITVVCLPENEKLTRGINEALRYVETDLVAYFCAAPGHTKLRAGWAKTLVRWMDEHPDVDYAGDVWDPYLHGMIAGPIESQLYAEGWSQAEHLKRTGRPPQHVQGGAWIARKKVFAEVGNFSSDYPHDHADVEFSFRLLSRGKKLGKIPFYVSAPAMAWDVDNGAFVCHHKHQAEWPRERSHPVKLDLASGARCVEGFEGVDIAPLPGVKHVVNLLQFPWPFAAESVDEIMCQQYIEHIPMLFWTPSDDWKASLTPYQVNEKSVDLLMKFFDEVHRILKPGGVARIVVPQAHNDRAFQDPTHRRFIVPTSFLYVDAAWRKENDLEHAAYGVKCDFPIKLAFIQHHYPDGNTVNRYPTEANVARTRHEWNFAGDLIATLMKRPVEVKTEAKKEEVAAATT